MLYLLLTISGTSTGDPAIQTDPSSTTTGCAGAAGDVRISEHVRHKYAARKTFCDLGDVGSLVVHVYRAHGLTSADLCGKSDPFCVLELVNARLQTHTEYKTLSPNWDKTFVL